MNKVWEVFWRFLLLGCTSFGGPAAHLGYFQKTFVQDKKWIEPDAYARLIALSQFLPGPGSSQVGFALGLNRAGLYGGIAAFIGFTLPSFVIIYLIATTTNNLSEHPWLSGVIHGLKLLAVVVVADATLNMQRSFCKERSSLAIAVLTAVCILLIPNLWTQISVLLLAAIYGIMQHKPLDKESSVASNLTSFSINKFPIAVFIVLFIATPLIAFTSDWAALFSAFYNAGSLVFGGGHVVLPLLQQTLAEAIDTDRFLLGYAAAQAIPGPMFTLATFLGADLMPNNSLLGALLATIAVFLPGFLLILGLHKSWENLATNPKIAGAVWGVNAAVVGLLLSALYQPVFISAVTSSLDMAIVIIGFFVIQHLKPPILLLVVSFALIGFLSTNAI